MTSETTPPPAVTTAQVTSPVVQDNATQPTVTSPVVPKAEVTPAPVVDPVAATTPPATDPAAGGQTTQQDWAIKRINELTAKRYEAERTAEAAKKAQLAAEEKSRELLAQITKTTTPDPAAPPAKPAQSDEDIERMVQERATAIAQANSFNEACNKVAATGKKEFTDWQQSLDNLNLVGALGKDVPATFLETAVELKDPHKILHHLGKNMDEAARIAKLPPQKMAVEMARIEATLQAPAPVSAAPAPVIPVAGATKVSPGTLDDPNISADDWYKIRAQQIEEKRNRYRRV